MSLLDNVRQTLGDAANTAREVGQNLGAQAQSQLNIKKMQLDQAKKLRDLGEKTFAWYQSGQLIVSGNVPADVQQLCREVDESSTQLRLEEAKLEEFKQQAAQRSQNPNEPATQSGATYPVLPTTNLPNTNLPATDFPAANATIPTIPTVTTPMAPANTATEVTSIPFPSAAARDTTNIMTGSDATNDYPTPALTNSGATGVSTMGTNFPTPHHEGGVTMPGTGIVTNPTPPASAPETLPPAVPATSGAETSDGDAPVVPVSDLAPSPQGDTTIGGGTMPGAPGGSDTLGGGISGGGLGGLGGGFGGGTM